MTTKSVLSAEQEQEIRDAVIRLRGFGVAEYPPVRLEFMDHLLATLDAVRAERDNLECQLKHGTQPKPPNFASMFEIKKVSLIAWKLYFCNILLGCWATEAAAKNRRDQIEKQLLGKAEMTRWMAGIPRVTHSDEAWRRRVESAERDLKELREAVRQNGRHDYLCGAGRETQWRTGDEKLCTCWLRSVLDKLERPVPGSGEKGRS